MTWPDPLLAALDGPARPRRMIRSDYRRAGAAACTTFPARSRLTSTFPFVGRSAELETLRALMPTGRGRGPPGRAARRRARLGQEPPRARVRAARRRATGALVLYGACDAVVRTPYGPFVEALDHLARVTDPGRAARRARHRGRRAHAPAARPAGPGRRPAAPGQGRSGHRAPPAAHGRDRPARGRQPRAGRCCS